MAQSSETSSAFEIKFTPREVSAWGGLALMKRMLDSMNFRTAASQWNLPEPGSNRGYPPVQLIEQLLVSVWCGACRFTHLDVTRMDSALTRLFGWTRVAGHKAIVRLFGRFDMMRHERVQASIYRWFFDTVSTLPSVTVDMDSTVITWHGEQQGAARGYNPNKRGRLSHHPLLAFVSEARMVANFWLRPGDANSANNVLQFIESTLHHLGSKPVGLLRADSGFFDQAVLKLLEGKGIRREPELDAHPLVREHFGALLEKDAHKAWQAGHSVLFDWFCSLPRQGTARHSGRTGTSVPCRRPRMQGGTIPGGAGGDLSEPHPARQYSLHPKSAGSVFLRLGRTGGIFSAGLEPAAGDGECRPARRGIERSQPHQAALGYGLHPQVAGQAGGCAWAATHWASTDKGIWGLE